MASAQPGAGAAGAAVASATRPRRLGRRGVVLLAALMVAGAAVAAVGFWSPWRGPADGEEGERMAGAAAERDSGEVRPGDTAAGPAGPAAEEESVPAGAGQEKGAGSERTEGEEPKSDEAIEGDPGREEADGGGAGEASRDRGSDEGPAQEAADLRQQGEGGAGAEREGDAVRDGEQPAAGARQEPAGADEAARVRESAETEGRAEAEKSASEGRAGEASAYLTLDAEPYADVRLGSQDLGTTPMFRREVAPGRYRVQIRFSSGETKDVTLELEPGEDHRERFTP